jgi:hypothetical protein
MWFRVDDQFWKHPKARAAGHAAIGAWVLLGAATAELDEDGFVPTAIARAIASRTELRRLVAVGLLEVVEGGYRFHDWDDIYRARTDTERQQARRRRQGASRNASRKVRNAGPTTDDRPPVLAPEDDDDRPAVTEASRSVTQSSSSKQQQRIDQAIAITAQAIYLQHPSTPNGQVKRYIAGIARNLRAERADEIHELSAAELDPVDIAARLCGSALHARQAAREIVHARVHARAHARVHAQTPDGEARDDP